MMVTTGFGVGTALLHSQFSSLWLRARPFFLLKETHRLFSSSLPGRTIIGWIDGAVLFGWVGNQFPHGSEIPFAYTPGCLTFFLFLGALRRTRVASWCTSTLVYGHIFDTSLAGCTGVGALPFDSVGWHVGLFACMRDADAFGMVFEKHSDLCERACVQRRVL